jgi:branched-subunit amino acid transport protein
VRIPWLVVLAIGVGTFLIRFSFLYLFERLGEPPELLERALRFVPAAVLAALVIPSIVAPEGTVALAGNLRLVAAAVAVVVAVRTESILWTIVSGLVVLVGLQAVL